MSDGSLLAINGFHKEQEAAGYALGRPIKWGATCTAYKVTFSMHQLKAPTFLIMGIFSSMRLKCLSAGQST